MVRTTELAMESRENGYAASLICGQDERLLGIGEACVALDIGATSKTQLEAKHKELLGQVR